MEVEIDECRKFIRELDTEREKEQVSLVEAQERVERLVDEQSRCPETHDILHGTQVTALQEKVNLLQSERDALAKELMAANGGVCESKRNRSTAQETDEQGIGVARNNKVPKSAQISSACARKEFRRQCLR